MDKDNIMEYQQQINVFFNVLWMVPYLEELYLPIN